MTEQPNELDLRGFLELHADDNDEPQPMVLGPPPPFPYVRQCLTLVEFQRYCASYGFGMVPPDSVCLHHTAVPTLANWTAREAGLTGQQLKEKRLKQLDSLKRYYNEQLHWKAGPHLFIDDRFILLMTPMFDPGIHAKWGNQFRDAKGKLHYSIGVEVIGDYTKQVWSPQVARMVGGCVQILHKKLGTFKLEYLYPDPAKKPGMKTVGGQQRCARPQFLKWGGVCSHRDFNKPQCPGNAITEAYYMDVVRRHVTIV